MGLEFGGEVSAWRVMLSSSFCCWRGSDSADDQRTHNGKPIASAATRSLGPATAHRPAAYAGRWRGYARAKTIMNVRVLSGQSDDCQLPPVSSGCNTAGPCAIP